MCLQTRSNSVAWNPMEAFNLTLANEDCNLYTYDIRKLKSAACVHQVRHACLGFRNLELISMCHLALHAVLLHVSRGMACSAIHFVNMHSVHAGLCLGCHVGGLLADGP